NPEQAPASHYNPNPMARNALISVNGGEPDSMLFVPTFHANNFWERTVYVDLEEGENTIRIGAEELTNFSGDGHIADIWPDYPWLRSDQGPILDRISVSPTHAPLPAGTSPGDEDPGDGAPGGDEPGEGTPSEEPAPAPGEDPADPGEEQPGDDAGEHEPGDGQATATTSPAAGNGDGSASGPGSSSGTDGQADTDAGDRSSQGPLARTGTAAVAMLSLALGLLVVGALVRWRAHGAKR